MEKITNEAENLGVFEALSKHYTAVPTSLLADETISWTAKGVACVFLVIKSSSMDKNKVVAVDDILASSKDKRSVILKAIAELREAGYIPEGQLI